MLRKTSRAFYREGLKCGLSGDQVLKNGNISDQGEGETALAGNQRDPGGKTYLTYAATFTSLYPTIQRTYHQ
ncbi:MAG: hypothetical protein FNP40_05035 [Dehalobacter sp. 4CP]|nr:hypothetical protein [Dehalobacter sp. 4CP]